VACFHRSPFFCFQAMVFNLPPQARRGDKAGWFPLASHLFPGFRCSGDFFFCSLRARAFFSYPTLGGGVWALFLSFFVSILYFALLPFPFPEPCTVASFGLFGLSFLFFFWASSADCPFFFFPLVTATVRLFVNLSLWSPGALFEAPKCFLRLLPFFFGLPPFA